MSLHTFLQNSRNVYLFAYSSLPFSAEMNTSGSTTTVIPFHTDYYKSLGAIY